MQPHDNTSQDVPLKRCAKCGEHKPATNEYFAIDQSKRSGLVSRCKTCNRYPPIHTVPLPDGYKVCSKCGEMKPETLEYFSSDKSCHNGLLSYCRVCNALARAQRKDDINEYQRRYRVENKERLNKLQRAYHARPDKRQRRMERDLLNKEKTKESRRNAGRRWRENNREASRAHARASELRRKARRLAAQGDHTSADIQRQHKAQKGKCYYCGVKVGDTYHVDHVIPLSRGGSNGPENIVIACPTCNMSKQDKLPHEWAGSNRLL